MKKQERREFRRAARAALRKAAGNGLITRLQRGRLLLKMRDNATVDEMADVCLAQAVECALLSEKAAGKRVKWAALGENIDWDKLTEFILKIISMFL